MSSVSLLSLLHLCDSLFPIGGFAHSDGLEAATARGGVSASSDLRDWMDVCLDESLARVDGPAVLLAWRAFTEQRLDDLEALDAEVHALRPSSTARSASRAMGARLLKTWQEIHPGRDLASFLAGSNRTRHVLGGSKRPRPAYGPRVTLPVAFGIVCAAARIESRAAVGGFLYTRLAAIVSSAMRLMPIGQREAHALLAAILTRVPATIDAIEAGVTKGDVLGAFAPAFDLATMEHQYVRSRLFLS
jgi:urease accessory protein